MATQQGYGSGELTYAQRSADIVMLSDGVRARKTDDGYVVETLGSDNETWTPAAGSVGPSLNDPDGNKAIDLAVSPASGRALYSVDGETEVASWGSVDAGIANLQVGPAFDYPGSIALVDPATFQASANTSTARPAVTASFVYLNPEPNPPGSPFEGMIYAKTDHHLYYYNGTTWKQLDN